jgi:predicted RNase H-like HicB family nuclease
MSKFVLPVVIEKDTDGYYAYCPSLQGCYSQGGTYEEALANIEDAMRLNIEDRIAKGESVPTSEMISLTTLEVVA